MSIRVKKKKKTSAIKSMFDYRGREVKCGLGKDQCARIYKSSQRKFCTRLGSHLSLKTLEQRTGKTRESQPDLREITKL